MPDHETALPSLFGWETTRDSLHAYSKVMGAFARVLAEPNSQWWHVSLKLEQGRLWTEELDPGGKRLRLSMDLDKHRIQVHDPAGIVDGVDMREGLSANELASRLTMIIEGSGLDVSLPQDKYASDAPTEYDPAAARAYLHALTSVFQAQARLRSGLPGKKSPIQLWPHNFDQAFEWFSSREVAVSGSSATAPAQINFGFAPGDGSHAGPYFYSNPWPFETSLMQLKLPHGAAWFEQGWTGSLLPYEALAEDEGGLRKLNEYYQRVFDLASPLLSP